MNLGYLTVIIVIVAFLVSAAGAWGIAKYAFRISTGKGLAVLLLPPYTFYFSFYELQEEGKEKPIALWMWGLVTTAVVLVAFFQPLQMVLEGRAAELNPPSEEELTKAYGSQGGKLEALPDLPPPPVVPEPTTNNGTNGTNNGTNGTNNVTNAGTNAAPAEGAAPAEAAPAEAAAPAEGAAP